MPGFPQNCILLSTWGLQDAAILVPAIFFLIWHYGLFLGEAGIPRRSYALLVITIVLSAAFYNAGWKSGVRYRGLDFTRFVGFVNLIWVAILAYAFGRTWKNGASFKLSLFLHWILFAWLAWYAFPYIGELP